MKMTSFKVIFSLLFFEHQYLGYHSTCMHQLLICVLDIISCQKTGNFCDFFSAKFHLLHPIKNKLIPISKF